MSQMLVYYEPALCTRGLAQVILSCLVPSCGYYLCIYVEESSSGVRFSVHGMLIRQR